MIAKWYYLAGGVECGPISDQELRLLVQRGHVRPDTKMRQRSNDPWIAAAEVRELWANPAVPPPARAAALPSPRPGTPVRRTGPGAGAPGAPPGPAAAVAGPQRHFEPAKAAAPPQLPSVPAGARQSSSAGLLLAISLGGGAVLLVLFLGVGIVLYASRASVETAAVPGPAEPLSHTPPLEVAAKVESPPPAPLPPQRAALSESGSLADLVDQIEPSIVWVVVGNNDRESISTGSGFVVDAAGWVVTNHHVIEDAVGAAVKFKSGELVPVDRVLTDDASRDLAILKLRPTRRPLRALALATTLPRKGERVATFGAPLDLTFTVTDGVISAIRSGREMNTEHQSSSAESMTWLQMTAPISPGNSGGPLVNMRGEVVGVNTMSRKTGNNLNFAVSSLDVLKLIEETRRRVK